MPEKQNAVIAVDIGTKFLKVIEAKTSISTRDASPQIQILRFFSQEMKSSGPQSINETLKNLVKNSHKIRICVAGANTVIRFIEMPKMSLEEFKSALRFEIDKYLPFPIEEVYFDGDILREKTDTMDVVIVAMKKVFLDPLISAFKSMGIFPEVIDSDNTSLINLYLFSVKDLPSKGKVSLINIGANSTSINILEDDLPRLSRTINLGIAEFLKEFSQTLNISSEEADSRKIEEAPVNLDSFRFFSMLFKDIRLTLDFYEVQSGSSVKRIFLSGGGSMIKDLDKVFVRNLNIDTQYLSASDLLNFAKDSDKLKFRQEELEFHSCLGLLVR